ncbi:MAG: peptidylprolyl isomerase [Flexistipes sinusarabici]|uniref:Peptidylprolyl isomerase n=1 Tax=Flexistipes sinusarabici TaxID=2352 RepID=A0A5D0MMK1_FLESI|nr:SurA N-terminal domain-containing protein [Flexistipes sinusarabici]TYB33622.1 MAG: peptidylprolyl isomerase [Flexistipes sinusarabici]
MLALLLVQSPLSAQIIDKILAVVGDEVITKYEVESFNPERVKQIYSLKNEEKKDNTLQEYYDNVLDFLVEQYKVELAAKREGVEVTEAETNAALQDVLTKNNVSMEQLKSALKERGLTLAKYKWQIKMDILKSRIMSRIIAPMVVVTNEDIRDYIDEHPELDLSDKYELRMIEVKNKDKFKKMKDYLENHSFSDTAIKFSKAASAKSGGYIGFVSPDQVAEVIQKKLEKAKTGDVFRVNNDNSIQLFKVESFSSKYNVDNKTREEIVSKIREEKLKKVYENWLKEHSETIYVKYKY